MTQDPRPEPETTPSQESEHQEQAPAAGGTFPESASVPVPSASVPVPSASTGAAAGVTPGTLPSEAPTPAIMAGMPVVPAHVTKQIFNSALKSMLLLVAVVLFVGSGIGYWVAGLPGLWSALLAVGVALIFSGTTIWSMIYTADKSPNTTMAVVLGAWVGKMLFFIIILAVLSSATFYHKTTFGIIVLVAVFGSALLDMRAVIKGRMPYVTPAQK